MCQAQRDELGGKASDPPIFTHSEEGVKIRWQSTAASLRLSNGRAADSKKDKYATTEFEELTPIKCKRSFSSSQFEK